MALGEVPLQLIDVSSCEGRRKFYSRSSAGAVCNIPRAVYAVRELWLNEYLVYR